MGDLKIRLALAWLPMAAGGAATAGVSTQDLQLRLESGLASYSRPGALFTARVQGPVTDNASPILPAGTIVRGMVRGAQSIGIGLRRERAGLTLEFQGCTLPGGGAAECDLQLLAVDNARETVHRDNRIRGVLAASHPPSLLSGLWYRPAAKILLRPVSGLAGAGGMLSKHILPGPVGAAVFIVSRLIFFRIPDPEIELPAGTELVARVSVPSLEENAPGEAVFSAPPPDASWPEGLGDWLASVPGEITRPDGAPMPDRINMAFVGTAAELSVAFAAAGWSKADPLNAKTFALTYSAFTGMKSYSRAPVSKLHYEGRLPDLVFQKSFNTLARRHHIRLWKRELPEGGEAWLGAATHDVAIAFDWNRMNLTHRIDPHIDRERSKVINDLSAASCLGRISSIARLGPVRRNPLAEQAITDGAVAAVELRACAAPPADSGLDLARPKRAATTLALRRVILETRQYLLRGNAYRFAYDSLRWTIAGAGCQKKDRDYAMALK